MFESIFGLYSALTASTRGRCWPLSRCCGNLQNQLILSPRSGVKKLKGFLRGGLYGGSPSSQPPIRPITSLHILFQHLLISASFIKNVTYFIQKSAYFIRLGLSLIFIFYTSFFNFSAYFIPAYFIPAYFILFHL